MVFYVQDEMSNRGFRGEEIGLAKTELFQKLGKKIGFRTCASINGPRELAESRHLNITIPNNSVPINEENIKTIKDNGSEFWIYNIGSNRFTFGYYLAKARPKGRLQWAFSAGYSPLTQIPSIPSLAAVSYSAMFDSNLALSKRWDVETMRQGIIDYRYFLSLKKQLELNRQTKNEKMKNAILKADGLLKKIMDAIDIGALDGNAMWSEETCQRLRWRMALAIKEINDAK
jgi:hypothetical protein